MRQPDALLHQTQRHARHDARRDGKHGPVHRLARLPIPLSAFRQRQPRGRDARAERLAQPPQQRCERNGLEAGLGGEVDGEGEGEAFGDVVDEEGEEDGEAERGVGVVGRVGDEAFGEFVQCNGDRGL